MSSQEENFVGLFIDWDNLAISTAVDFAGAVPDVRAIVKAAQKYGTVLLARAYAEWNVTSERLSVYRAGIEPVYAPTFRFESETGGNGSRGKSLADPCLVTDCIDILHLMPEINIFVLVSGDKDMIPIVRLAQLRGKRVVVIGPDFAAAILREMADEYIPYRQLAEASDNPPTEVSVHGVRSHRRSTTSNRGASSSSRSQSSARSASVPSAPAPSAAKPALPESNGSSHREGGTATEAVTEAPPVEAPVVEAPPVEEVLDPEPLFAVIATVLREREQLGKPRLRATNLKDQLIARIGGFNERKYGFARFKDLLAAAEKANVLSVSRTGPVQWVTAPESAAPPADASPAPTVAETPAVLDESVDPDVVRFILELRGRSRWLTYTYVLTNLLNHLGNGSADAASDAEARATLNRLVQAGVVVVDREPREIDVNGTHHRVRLCHVMDEHPLVQRVAEEVASTPTETPAVEISPAAPPEPEAAANETASETAEPPMASASGEPVATVAVDVPTDGNGANGAAEVAPEAPSTNGEASESAEVVSEATLPAAEPEARAEAPSENRAPTEESGDSTAAEPVAVAESAKASNSKAEEANGSAGDAAPADGTDGEDSPPALPTIEESFAVLRDVVGEATDANRPTTGPAAVKNRLVRRLGTFDERALGFGKFKDYLIAAERAGAIRLEVSGNTTRVALPAPAEPVAEAE